MLEPITVSVAVLESKSTKSPRRPSKEKEYLPGLWLGDQSPLLAPPLLVKDALPAAPTFSTIFSPFETPLQVPAIDIFALADLEGTVDWAAPFSLPALSFEDDVEDLDELDRPEADAFE